MGESNVKDENFYQICGFMINRLGLKGVPLNVYAIIYGFSQDGESEYSGGLQYLCDFCGGVSKPTIINALKTLTESGFILRREENINNICFPRYRVNLPLLKNLNGGKETLTGGLKNLNGGSKEILPNIKDIYINNKYIYNAVVEYLNEKANTSYKPTSKATQHHINARIAEGFTIDDFKTVIDKKCAEWLSDPKMQQYLRPETLFGTKFESYLNAKSSVKKSNNTTGSIDFEIIKEMYG